MYRNLDDAVAQAEHDLERGLPVDRIEDNDGNAVKRVRDGKLVAK